MNNNNIKNSKIKKIFKVDPDLEIKEELISIHGLNPFVAHTSSPRSYMFSSHLSQTLVLNDGDEKIIQTGLEKQLGENTISKIVDRDVRVLKIIYRYGGLDESSITHVVETVIIVEDIDTGEIDYISIPYYHKLHPHFGFKYKKNEELLSKLRVKSVLPKGTILASPPSLTENYGYKFGVNANLCLLNLPETVEDGVVISKRIADKLSYSIYETRTVEFGTKSLPLNIYGDDDNYKAFPEIGELVNDDSVIMVLRDYDPKTAISLFSINDLKSFNPVFDKAFYVKGPGKEIKISGKTYQTGKVVDIKAYMNPAYKKDEFNCINGTINKYAQALRRFHSKVVEAYEEIRNEHYKRYQNYEVPMSESLQRFIRDSYALRQTGSNARISYINKNENVDLYRIEFTIEYTVIPSQGFKTSDSYGSKGVIVEVRNDEDMPFTIVDGEKVQADIVMDPSSLISRMNVGRVYEHYFNAMSRTCQRRMIQHLQGVTDVTALKPKQIESAYNMLLDFLSILGTEQYDVYSSIKDIGTKTEIIHECLTKEVFIYYKVSSKKKAYQIIEDVKGTMFEPPINAAFIKTADGRTIETKGNVLIAPIYTILLSKTGGDSSLSVGSAKVNHYGVPIGISNNIKNSLPWRNSPTKILSETETRLYLSYVSRLGIAELKDRANSMKTHDHLYTNILNAEQPTNMEDAVDRNVMPYAYDNTLELIDNIFNSFGLQIVDTNVDFEE